MAASQARFMSTRTLLPPTLIRAPCGSHLASSPSALQPFRPLFFRKLGEGLCSWGLAQNTVVCPSNDVTRPPKRRPRRGNPCPAVAAQEAPQTSKPRFDGSVFGEEYSWAGGKEVGPFLERGPRGRGSAGAKFEVQRRRWEGVTTLRAEARRAVLEVGVTAEGEGLRERKLGRLQKLLEVEMVGEGEDEEESGGPTLAEAFTLAQRRVSEEAPGLREEVTGQSQKGRGLRGGVRQKSGKSSTAEKEWSQERRKGPHQQLQEKVASTMPPVSLTEEQPADGTERGALLGARDNPAIVKKNRALLEASLAERLDIDLGVEEDIEGALDRDLAALFTVTAARGESGPLGGPSDSGSLLGGKVRRPMESLEELSADRGSGRKNFGPSVQHRPSRTLGEGSSPQTLTSFLKGGWVSKQREPSTEQNESEPTPRGWFSEPDEPPQDSSAALDPLLDVLEDASAAKARISTPLHQRTYKTQHVLKRRQQKALSASDEDEALLRQPWEVKEPRPETGLPVGLELFADDRVTSPEVRVEAFEPKHDKKPGGARQWQPNKRRLYYAQKFADRWGGGDTPAVETPPKAAEISGGKMEKRPVEENHFLFPPLPRPVPHEIVNRKKVETMPVGSFRSVPPKQRKVLPIREAAGISRGLGGRLVVPDTGSSAVTSEMREEARRDVLQRLLVAAEGDVNHVLDEVASLLHSKDVTFLLHELSTRGNTNRALDVLRWAEKAPRKLSRLRPGAAAYATVLQGLVREGDAKRAADFAIFTRARGIPPGKKLWGLLLTALAGQGEHGKVWEVLDRMQKRGQNLDGRAWRGLISTCARGDKRLAKKLVSRVMELADRGEVKLTRFDYEEIVGACSGAGLLDEALTLVETMETEGFRVGADVYGKVMCTMSKAGQHSEVLEMYRRACQESQGSIYVHNAAIRSVCCLGRQLEAREVVQRMLVSGIRPDVVTYNTIISSLSRSHRQEEALEVLEEMQQQGCQPTPLTFKALGSGREP
ncbi:putative Pentatricopeptide repeat domain containing protein [Klebsormidium nitens]|uniref:Putative Pentatricopeptide repeat domain containing protein n=1 Tax=Klebsormidium nitens TaxID=105231 RepID=A0A0U9HJH9_KLENI|nr:putative Pentatricopeptide repeat domain containing protein [Klebsormidium nitens]|eukprot:GAQ82035.1 putative Pentatricopeptide repeat domain containing protein [Klebsormidium nitens]